MRKDKSMVKKLKGLVVAVALIATIGLSVGSTGIVANAKDEIVTSFGKYESAKIYSPSGVVTKEGSIVNYKYDKSGNNIEVTFSDGYSCTASVSNVLLYSASK